MPNSLEGILLVMGGLFLLIGLIGGEFEVSAAKIPRVGTPGRIGAVVVGVVCLTLALRSIIAGRSPDSSPAVAQTSAAPPQNIAPAAVAPVPAPSPRRTSEDCVSGYVWRVARPSDLVCVTPDTRTRTAEENAAADANRLPAGGEYEYGPNTCRAGLVWREAFDGDVVCVTRESQQQALYDNSQSPRRKAQ
jgi:hypothetical protein